MEVFSKIQHKLVNIPMVWNVTIMDFHPNQKTFPNRKCPQFTYFAAVKYNPDNHIIIFLCCTNFVESQKIPYTSQYKNLLTTDIEQSETFVGKSHNPRKQSNFPKTFPSSEYIIHPKYKNTFNHNINQEDIQGIKVSNQ